MKTASEMTQIIKLLDKDIKTVVITIIHLTIIYKLKKVKESMSPAGFFIKIDF